MRHQLTFLVFFISVSTLQAQKLEKLRIGIGAGYAIYSASSQNGVLLTVEPSYKVNNNFSIGMKYETVAKSKFLSIRGAKEISSISLNGQYYFTDKSLFQPFFGLGVGVYSAEEVEFANTQLFGIYPKVGFDLKHFSFCVEHNILSKGNGNNYLGVKGGVFVGGGR